MEPVPLFPTPASPLQYLPPAASPKSPPSNQWVSYWITLLWYVIQGGRVAISLGIACVIWTVFSLLPGVLAWLLTWGILILVGQYNVKIKHTKKD